MILYLRFSEFGLTTAKNSSYWSRRDFAIALVTLVAPVNSGVSKNSIRFKTTGDHLRFL